ncbi:mycothione reductase [Brevibacterium sp.]|uniref:mycothione reductase n=1 Tax=Brevibacterium sp. TaxID=1701 RepID=UPI0025BB0F91|nr:mycothione reductase [Brevibacterium sp.]
MTHFDVLVIGTGSGNSIINHRFDGLRVAIAEEDRFGGTCLNAGCIPTKMYVYPATRAEEAADSSAVNLSTSYGSADWPALRDRIFARIDAIEADGRAYRTERQENVTVFPEHVRFTGPHSLVTASGREITADRIVIAAGSAPVVPEIPGLDPARVDAPGSPFHTSRTIMRLDSQPESVLILGSGFISAEFGHIFSGLGTRTVVAIRGDRMLPGADAAIRDRFTAEFSARHDVRPGVEAASVRVLDDGRVEVALRATGRVPGAEVPAPLIVERVLLATGRAPASAGLSPQAAGIDTRADGRIAVDEYLRVLADGAPVPGVFALGDISSPHQLKHVANHEARVVKANLVADLDAGAPGGAPASALTPVNHKGVPAAVFSSPQVAHVGMTEEEARAAGHDVVVGTRDYGGVAYGWAMEDTTGFVKVVADRSSRLLLGAHLMGPEASMIIQPLIQAIAFDQPADEVAKGQYWIHPALPEVVENALLDLDLR